MRALPVLLLAAGCGLFGGKGGRRGQSQPTQTAARGNLDLTLVSRCTHPVEVCYGSAEKCLTLDGHSPRSLRAATGTGEVFVTLKGSSASSFADATFSLVEVDESCAHLGRRLKP
jgi:hypothetical protein